MLLTNRGVPLIYYGDEIGLAGGGDPDNRRMMPWAGLNAHQTALRTRVTRMAQLRAQHVALRRGYRQSLSTGNDTLAYKMTGCGASEDVYVLVNRSDAAANVSGLPAGSYTEQITSAAVTGGGAVSVPARTMYILTLN